MKKKLLLAAACVMAASLLWLGAGGGPGWTDRNLGFGQKVAGGWLMVADVGTPVEIMVNLAADGGAMFNGTLRPAGPDNTGGWMGTRYNTTSHGTWTRTGHNTFEMVTLLFIQDNDGNTVLYEKVMMELALKAGGTKLEGTGLIHLIEQGNDPLDSASPVLFPIPVASISGRLIR